MRIYLAGPYSHDDVNIRSERESALSKKAAELMLDGHVVFSPITHGHALLEYLPEYATTFAFWEHQDLSHLLTCDALYVLCMDGWGESRGVKQEIEWAVEAGIVVKYIKP